LITPGKSSEKSSTDVTVAVIAISIGDAAESSVRFSNDSSLGMYLIDPLDAAGLDRAHPDPAVVKTDPRWCNQDLERMAVYLLEVEGGLQWT
jgi:hypothetical protein